MSMRKFSKKDRLALIMLLVAASVVVVLLTMRSFLSKKPAIDELTLCPAAGEKQRAAVLIDKSDKWGKGDVARVRDLLLSINREVPAQGRLTIYSITGDGRKSTDVNIVFDMCNPGSEAECNTLYQNCKKVKKDFERAFDAPLHRLVETMMVPGESSSSPILETVGAMVKDSKGDVLKLYIISDFMENGARFRFYDVIPTDEEMIEQYPFPRKLKITADAYLIQRRIHPMPLQKAVQRVWTGYFERQGATVNFRPIFTAD